MLLRCVTTSLSLRNYLPPQKMYAKGYNKYFSRIQWTRTLSYFSIISRDRQRFVILNTEGIRKDTEEKRNFVIFLLNNRTTVSSVFC